MSQFPGPGCPVAAGSRGLGPRSPGGEGTASCLLVGGGPVSKGGQAAEAGGMRFSSSKARSGLKLWHHDKEG